MDRQDKEFEAFLQQFRLRKHRPFPEEPGVEVGTGWTRRRWILVAAAAAVVAAVSFPVIRQFSHKTSLSAIVQVPGDSTYRAGEVIAAGTPIRSGATKRLLARLEDGTHVEVRPESELVLEPADDGARIRLKHGSILVSAAEQKDGQLQVEAHDIVATVVGTVFLVETQPSGSRVGVLEGEVEVRHKLGEGQQVSTDASLQGQSLAQAIAWSSRALPSAPPPEPAIAPVRRVRIPTPPQAAPSPQPSQPRQEQPPPPKPADDAGADGPGRALVEGMCASCHAVDLTTGRTATREEWQGIIDRMKGYGTAMDDKQTTILLDYLVRRHGPKQTPPPAAPAGGDGPGKQTFYRACVACHSDEVVRSRQWASREAVATRVEIDIRAGAQVTPSEVPALVDFIFQTWGVRFR